MSVTPGVAVLRARYLWTSGYRCFSPGELVVDGDGRVLHVGHGPSRVPDRAIFPGLVNAHVHLQIPRLPRREVDFLRWVREVMAVGHRSTSAMNRSRASSAIVDLLASGTTAVGEVDSTGESPTLLRKTPMAGRCYQELAGYHLGPAGARRLLAERRLPGSAACPGGLSPHAPYSASAAVFRAARASGLPLMVHAAETADEQQFLQRGRGRFRELLESLDRLPAGFRAPGVGAIEWLDRLGVLGPRTALVHCQHLEAGDLDRIRSRGAVIVVCPGTIRYFRRRPPDVERWLEMGIAVALGTDSRASNVELSMISEISLARRLWPRLSPRTVLAMVTAHGARALARPGIGSLRPGRRADCFSVSTVGCGSADEVLERFTRGKLEVAATILGGRRIPRG